MADSATFEWSAIRDEHDRMMMKDLYEAAQKAGALHKLAGIQNLSDPVVDEIHKHMQFEGHSGASFGCTISQVQYVLEHGFNAFLRARGDPVCVTGE
jgi:hypothetical protein